MNIEVLLTEAEIAEEFAESLDARDLPEKFFYWLPASVKAWREIAGTSHESLRPTWDALSARAAELAKSFPAKIPVISLGAGDGSKDRVILKALLAAGRELKYFPVDSSQNMLEMACAAAEDEECDVLGIKADISSPMHLTLAADVSESPRLFLMVGNTLGGFDPLDQIRLVAECLHKGDILLVDGQLYEQETEFPSGRHEGWVFSPLASVGIQPEDGEIKFAESADDRWEGLYLLTRRFQTTRDLNIRAMGREIHIERGERIVMNFRFRFTRAGFHSLLTRHAGLKVLGEIPSADGRFVTAVCVK
jgi:hypothetical protein